MNRVLHAVAHGKIIKLLAIRRRVGLYKINFAQAFCTTAEVMRLQSREVRSFEEISVPEGRREERQTGGELITSPPESPYPKGTHIKQRMSFDRWNSKPKERDRHD